MSFADFTRARWRLLAGRLFVLPLAGLMLGAILGSGLVGALAQAGVIAPLVEGPTGFTAAIPVNNASNTQLRYSATSTHLWGVCTVETAGLNVYLVNANDANTSSGEGPYCDTCNNGPHFLIAGRDYARTSAGAGTVRCRFYDASIGGAGGVGGGMSMGLADGRYVNVSGDTMTGALTTPVGTACSAPALRLGDSDTGLALTDVGTAPGHAIEMCVDGTRAGLISIGASPATFSYGNTVLGWGSGLALDLSGGGAGDDAIHNTLLGAETGVAITTGMQNTAVGNRVLHNTTTASQNTCIGQGSCYEVTNGTNTGVGFHTMVNVDATAPNTAVGYRCLEGTNGSGATATGGGNTVVGYLSMSNYSTADNNVCLGNYSCEALTTGDRNTIVGWNAGDDLTASIDSTIIGREAGQALTSENGNTIVGAGSGYLLTDTENALFGWAAAPNATTATRNTVLGSLSGTTLTTGDRNVLIGSEVDVNSGGRSDCIAIGRGASCAADASIYLGTASQTQLITSAVWRGPSGTLSSVGVGHSTMIDAGLAWDTGIDGLYLSNNTGSTVIVANGGGMFLLEADAASTIRTNDFGQDIDIDPSGELNVQGTLDVNGDIVGANVTGTGPGGVYLWQMSRIVNANPVKPTCNSTWEASIMYVDDTDDGFAGMPCTCIAADAARTTWGWLNFYGGNCPGA